MLLQSLKLMNMQSILLIVITFIVAGCSIEKNLGDKVKNWDPYMYNVQYGDTLYSIAWRYDLDFKSLAQWNNIPKPFTIFPSQRLKMRGPASPSPDKNYLFGSVEKEKSDISSPIEAPDYSDPENIPKAPPILSSSVKNKTHTRAPRHKTRPAAKPVTKTKPEKINLSASFSKGKIKWSWPISGKVITTYAANNHDRKGIDIKGVSGQKIKSAGKGVVVYSGGGLISYGNLIIIKHNDRFLSAYAHNKKLLVKEGTAVKRGQTIAIIGKTPNVTNLLHFEIRKDGKPVNPLVYLP